MVATIFLLGALAIPGPVAVVPVFPVLEDLLLSSSAPLKDFDANGDHSQ
jgi:hypothetical protein